MSGENKSIGEQSCPNNDTKEQLLRNLGRLGPGCWSKLFSTWPAPELVEWAQAREGRSEPRGALS